MQYTDMKNILNEYFDFKKANPDTDFDSSYLHNKSFFKYYSFRNDHSIPNLKNNYLYCSSPSNFNDPYDCYPYLNVPLVFDKIEQGLIPYRNMDENLQERINKTYYKQRNNLYISCLTDTFDSILMWSHYSDNHKGFCVEYDLENTLKEYDTIVAPIRYKTNRPFISVPSEEDIKTQNQLLEYNRSIYKTLLTKHSVWKYESEYRIFLPNEDYPDHIIKNVKIINIYVGAKVSELDLVSIALIINEKNINNPNSKINLYRMKLAGKSYQLTPEEIFIK